MTITTQPYQRTDTDRWDQFVETANNGTLFHLRKFLQYHPEDRFSDHSLLFTEGEKLLAILPAAERISKGQKQLISHPGATYGGLVFEEKLSIQTSLDLATALIEHVRAAKFDKVTMTLPPIIYNQRLTNYMEFALTQHGFNLPRREISSVLYLEDTAKATVAKFSSSSQRAVKKAKQSGLTVKVTHDFEAFYPILEHNLETRHNVKPTHTLAELQRLGQLFPHDIYLLGAYQGDQLIAGIVVFNTNKRVQLAFYISHDQQYQQHRPVTLLFHELVHKGVDEGFRYLDFGIFTVYMEPNLGLARFKESFGAGGIFRDTMTLDITH